MTDKGFDAGRYVVKLRGKDYLEVKWRLVWFRTAHPDGVIQTELIEHDRSGQWALFRASVTAPGIGSATGWGQEEAADFNDYLEKAETKALGRALAALGFGTQFTEDFEFGAAEDRVVDSPVQRPVARQPQRSGHLLDEAVKQGAQPANLATAAAIQREGSGTISREEWLKQRAEQGRMTNGRS